MWSVNAPGNAGNHPNGGSTSSRPGTGLPVSERTHMDLTGPFPKLLLKTTYEGLVVNVHRPDVRNHSASLQQGSKDSSTSFSEGKYISDMVVQTLSVTEEQSQ
jgi:hypothetical protein